MSFHSVLLSFFSPVPAGGEGDITWLKNGEEIDDEEKVSTVDESASKLSIKKATMQDAGRYTCHCEFNSGHTDDVHTQVYIHGK